MLRAARSACTALLAGAALALAAAAAGQAALPAGFVGLCSDQSYWIEDEFTAGWNIALQKRSGIENVRVAVRWSDLELSPGVWNYARSDRVVRRLVTRGLDMLPVLQTPPPFRSSAPADPNPGMYPPKSNAEFAQFAARMVGRYGPGGSFWRENPDVPVRPITAWQVWNEPNIPPWWASGPNAAEYVQLLRTTSAAIRSADPGAEVVSAGIPDSRMGIPQQRYLREMYSAGARGSFDTLGLHGYASTVDEMVDQIRTTRALMSEFRDRSPIWLTEFGWATGGIVSAFTTTEAGQAARIGLAIRTLAAERETLGLRGFHIFTWQDIPGYGSIWPYFSGLVRADGSPKPGGWAFLDAVAEIRADAGEAPVPPPALTSAPAAPAAPDSPAAPGSPVGDDIAAAPPEPASGGEAPPPSAADERPTAAVRPPIAAPVAPAGQAFRVLRASAGNAGAGLAYFPSAGDALVLNRGSLPFAVVEGCRRRCRVRAEHVLSLRTAAGAWRRIAVRAQILRLSRARAGVLRIALTPAQLARLRGARRAKLTVSISSLGGEHGARSAPASLVVVLAPAR